MAHRLSALALALFAVRSNAAGYRTVGSSGVAAQLVFLPPFTDTAVFVDNYHENHGYPTVDLATGQQNNPSWLYSGTQISVFGAEFNWNTYAVRPLQPMDDTFCSTGAFFPDGTLVNIAGAEAGDPGVAEGFDHIRTFPPGPCQGNTCTTNWVERNVGLANRRWYPSAQTLVSGDIVVVGGSDAGGLVLNEANINVPNYEIVSQSGKAPTLQPLPILEFTADQNLDPGFSYNLFPLHNSDHILTIAGNRSSLWDYSANKEISPMPDTPLQARTFPSSASGVLLPLMYPDYVPEILLCGGSSGDMPNPLALSDCYTLSPQDPNPSWQRTDDLPNGPQTMSDSVLLPDGTVLFINGARKGCGGGVMAETPVTTPVIYNPSAPKGQKFTSMPDTNIPRMYHAVATLLPSGEVLVAGSNPLVVYTSTGGVPGGWPEFYNNGHLCALHQQQSNDSFYPTEYRVEIFSPPYIGQGRPTISNAPTAIGYGVSFDVTATLNGNGLSGNVHAVLSLSGVHTHGQSQGQRMVMLEASLNQNIVTIMPPSNESVMPPGAYLLWVVSSDNVPSVATWVTLSRSPAQSGGAAPSSSVSVPTQTISTSTFSTVFTTQAPPVATLTPVTGSLPLPGSTQFDALLRTPSFWSTLITRIQGLVANFKANFSWHTR